MKPLAEYRVEKVIRKKKQGNKITTLFSGKAIAINLTLGVRGRLTMTAADQFYYEYL